MHHLIQHAKVRSQVINVPEGLPELLSDITREVLRCQPATECLCQFIIDYLHSVIVTHEKAKIAQSVINHSLRIVDDIIANMCVCDIPKTKADQMSEVMEECFRRFLAQRRCEKHKEKEIIKFNEFDMLDELVKKCKFSDNELKISRPVIEAAYQKFANAYMAAQENTEGTESLYQYFREREIKRSEERLRTEAAIKIQDFQEVGTTVSKISQTTRPANHHDFLEDKHPNLSDKLAEEDEEEEFLNENTPANSEDNHHDEQHNEDILTIEEEEFRQIAEMPAE